MTSATARLGREVLAAGASGAGQVLGAGFGAAARVRRTKPLHPKGSVVVGRVERTGVALKVGVPWLDESGSDPAVVRFSRSLGLPDALPDVLGLAIRVLDGEGPHDVLLASAPQAPLLRHLLLPRRDALGSAYSSSFTYSTPQGPVVLAASPEGSRGSFALKVASTFGGWQRFGTLRVSSEKAAEDALIDLDAVCNPLPGLRLSPLLAALREPSYARARQGRPAPPDPILTSGSRS